MIATIDDLTLIVYLNAGCLGETFLSKKKGSNELYATKRIAVQSIYQEPCLKKYIENEIMILKKVKHPNIVKLFDVKVKKDYIYLVMEYCNGGSLSEALNNYLNKYGAPFSEELVRYLMKQILSGVECLHKHGIIHRDLKLENILLKYKSEYEAQYDNIFLSQIKIIDFDISSRTDTFNYNYKDPTFVYNDFDEIICDEKVDIWSLGILCYEMMTGKKPLKEGEKITQIQNINIKIPKNISLDAQSFLFCMLQKDGEKRFSASDLLRHNFILKNSVDNIYTNSYEEINGISSIQSNVNKLYTPIYINKNRSIFGRQTFYEKQDRSTSLPKQDTFICQDNYNQFRYSIPIKQTANTIQYNLQSIQPLYKQYVIGKGMDMTMASIIVNYCKYYYIQTKGGKSTARLCAEVIKRKLGDDWLVFISDLKCRVFDFNISIAKNGDFIVFSLDNKLFQICRY